MSASADVSITNPRKRGRDDEDAREIDARNFTVKPDPSDPYAAPRIFTPLCLLSRAQLPLAYLDTSASGSRLFTAHINLLEAVDEHNDEATVLVAAEAKEKKLHAIERVNRRVYALCRLGEWVTEEDVMMRSRCVMKHENQRKKQALPFADNCQPWWISAAVDMLGGRQENTMKARLDVKTDLKVTYGSTLPVCKGPMPASDESNSPDAEIDPPAGLPQSPTDVMQELAKQYLDALYLSRTSLAYFTKGPLSRARAAFAAMTSQDASLELATFLRESILASTIMDKKFKDGIPEVVKELPANGVESPEQPKKTKRKRKWKSKRDKRGFFIDEEDVVERWWKDYDSMCVASSTAETNEQALRRRMPKLRTRETFMQLILILETLALEAILPASAGGSVTMVATTAAETQSAETQEEDTQVDATEKKPKPKKKQDLSALLETLLDKLCIWHSLEMHSPAKQRRAENYDGEDVNDELKSFCIEVIIPFYISRIPQHANTVNKKLGGPSAPAPAKRKTAAIRKPGEPAPRPAPEKRPRKPLERVATDVGGPRSRLVPSLARSATDTDALLSHIKRETSEVPMETIPVAKPQRRPRQSLMHSLNSSHRQVDLTAMSQANDAKLKKKAETQEKMQSAINMLRKPNRAAALEELRNETDESFAKATHAARSRQKSGGHKARDVPQKPHIAATPSHGRTVKATPYKRAADALQAERLQSSAITHITSSSDRLPQAHELAPFSGFAIPQTGHRPRHATLVGGGGVAETPSRGFAKFMPPGLARQPGTLESPIASRKVAATPTKPVRSLSLAGSTASSADQPLDEGSPNVQRRDVTEQEGEAAVGGAKSIYDSLGWDENEYAELP